MVATLSQKELISQVKEKGWEISRGEKAKAPTLSPEVQNEKLIKSVINALDGINSKLERDSLQSKSLSSNLVLAAKIMAELGTNQMKSGKESTIILKRRWHMDVVRDGEGLIKKIGAEEI